MGKSGSSSQANQTTTTLSSDSRIANQSGLVATGESTINSYVQSLDAETVKAALDFASGADALHGAGFTKLLDVSERLNTRTQESALTLADRATDAGLTMVKEFAALANKTTDAATSMAGRFEDNVLQAYSSAKADQAGGFDQKTIVMLAATAGAVLVALNWRKN